MDWHTVLSMIDRTDIPTMLSFFLQCCTSDGMLGSALGNASPEMRVPGASVNLSKGEQLQRTVLERKYVEDHVHQ